MLPKRRTRERSGIERAPQRVFQTHRQFVRRHRCCVPGCEDGPIQFAHVRIGSSAGMGQKPSDANGISLCFAHHDEQHRIGERSFEVKYRIDLSALASEFARRTTDRALQEALRADAVTKR